MVGWAEFESFIEGGCNFEHEVLKSMSRLDWLETTRRALRVILDVERGTLCYQAKSSWNTWNQVDSNAY